MRKRILIQLDCDPQPSVFDAVVALDAGADELLRHGGVTPESVVSLVHGAIFTRGVADLSSTAIFVGGSDVRVAESVYERIKKTFFGPLRVSVMLDPAGANTTASAAVVAASRHLPIRDAGAAAQLRALVLGGSGPVGQRVARLLAGKGLAVAVASRSRERAESVCGRVRVAVPAARIEPLVTAETGDAAAGFLAAIRSADVIVSAGAAGVTLLDEGMRGLATSARVLVDLNAVPPAGIEGVVVTDDARENGRAIQYGALGVGGTKMKIHKAAVRRLFDKNDACLDSEELIAIGEAI